MTGLTTTRVTCPYCAGRGILGTLRDPCDQCDNGSVLVTAADPPTLSGVPLDAETLRELSRSARNVDTWTTKRNELIRAAHAAGGGVREIARATGLNPATVHNILKPRSRGGTRADT